MGMVIRRWVWLEAIGVVSGCFLHITYIFLLHLYLFFFAAYICDRACINHPYDIKFRTAFFGIVL